MSEGARSSTRDGRAEIQIAMQAYVNQPRLRTYRLPNECSRRSSRIPGREGRHAQTIVGRYLGGERQWLAATSHEVDLPDGDRLLVLETIPPAGATRSRPLCWSTGWRGVPRPPTSSGWPGGCSHLGIRVVRVNLRGAGDGFGLARGIYHAGRSDDLREVVAWLDDRVAGSPIAPGRLLAGRQPGLEAGRRGRRRPRSRVSTACWRPIPASTWPPAPADAAARESALRLELRPLAPQRWSGGSIARFPELGHARARGRQDRSTTSTIATRPRGPGFASADDYYERCSLVTALARIEVPGLIVHAMDDPFIPHEPVSNADPAARISLSSWSRTAATWAISAAARGRATAAGWMRGWRLLAPVALARPSGRLIRPADQA